MNGTTKNKRIWMAIITICVFIALVLLVFMTLPDFMEFTAATYNITEITPFELAYCPGDVIQFPVSLSRDREGPVEIIGSWCRVSDGICPLEVSTVRKANIARPLPSLTFTASRTIPKNQKMNAGEIWEYVHTSRMLGTADSSLYTVKFKIADWCE